MRNTIELYWYSKTQIIDLVTYVARQFQTWNSYLKIIKLMFLLLCGQLVLILLIKARRPNAAPSFAVIMIDWMNGRLVLVSWMNFTRYTVMICLEWAWLIWLMGPKPLLLSSLKCNKRWQYNTFFFKYILLLLRTLLL